MDGLLDSNIVIDLLRRTPDANNWKNSNPHLDLGISSIVWMEVVQGATDTIKRAQAIRFMRAFKLVHYESVDSFWGMFQFAQYHLSHGVEITDVMIAAISIRLNVPLYTRNLKHYNPLPGVQVIKPY